MTPEAKNLFAKVKACFQSSIMEMEGLKNSVLAGEDTKELVDLIYALREAYGYADELRKELEKLRKLCARVAVVHCDSQMIEKVKTEYCTGTPKETSTYNYPARRIQDPERFDTLMAALGIPQDVYTQELVRIHWPEFQAYCQRLLEEGKNPPAGIDPADSNPVYDFSIRKRKEIEGKIVESKEEEKDYAKSYPETPF